MASKINADEFVDREGEGKPTLPKGVVLSGVTTITTAVVAENEVANSTGINAGIITSTHFAGNLTGDVNAGIVTVTSQSVIGSAVTISASGIDIGAGVITATSYAGSGSGLTGIGATIMVWEYNPDPSDMAVPLATGIGISFNQKIKAGSGNITLRKDSSSGDLVENFGIGSSVTIVGNSLTIDPTSDLDELQVYHLSYPSGVITNMAGDNYVGTAYTFKGFGYNRELWNWGEQVSGNLGQNQASVKYSSPVQIPGTTWQSVGAVADTTQAAVKTDGTLWVWGYNGSGALGLNQAVPVRYSSPVQVGSDTTWNTVVGCYHEAFFATKTDSTCWVWGSNYSGQLGQNQAGAQLTSASSPVQVPGTTWDGTKIGNGEYSTLAVKTDGTLWAWGAQTHGELGQNQSPSGPWWAIVYPHYSSPVQIPGTNWSKAKMNQTHAIAIKTDGTLWAWGANTFGNMGQNQASPQVFAYSSPVQIPGTTWSDIPPPGQNSFSDMAMKTDGTMWAWGANTSGEGGVNDVINRSSPVQVGSDTTWSSFVSQMAYGAFALKTDGTMWGWGENNYGNLGQNQATAKYSSPVQIGSGTWDLADQAGHRYGVSVIKKTT